MFDRKSIYDIENVEVRKEVFKLLENFEEGFLNGKLEVVICHPINPVDIGGHNYSLFHGRGKNVYCNYYFRIEDCKTKLDVKRKVISWFSKPAHGGDRPAGEEASKIIADYIRNGINEYLVANFDRDEWELIYCTLGNGINGELCEKFILSHYDISLLKGEKQL